MLLLLLACTTADPIPNEAPAVPAAAAEAEPPNVLLYVIDGGGADLMSLYGYGRPTTRNLEALAETAIVFDAARTSSAWTKPSTASFMTSLHHSVLGGYTTDTDPIPASATTMAEHFEAAGYATGVFTTNPFAGSMSGLQAGVDHFRDKGAKLNSTSSVELHAELLDWIPADGPWWAHVQTTDVHEPHQPVPPYAGLYASPERRAAFDQWWADVHALGIRKDTVLGQYRARLEHLGIAPSDFFRAQWDLYDEAMTHNDATLDQLIGDLRARGEWENTLLIVTADHGHPAGSFSRFGRGLVDPQPEDWEGAMADSWRTWVPLVVSWPARLKGGRRVSQPVSLIDLLPTVLELTGRPPAAVQQGHSFAPLVTGEGHWNPRPLIIEQVQAWKETGEMVGHIEIIDGRWAASLEVLPDSLRPHYATVESLETAGGWRASRPHRPSTPPLLLYDLEADPHCLKSVHDAHPDEVARYTKQLSALWRHHQALAAQFEKGAPVTAGDAQLEALRTLGYVE
jgi:arylsulfatase A-like enzyme